MSGSVIHDNLTRILYGLLLSIAVFYLPWWFAISVIFVGIFVFQAYYEALFFALFIDTIYGIHSSSLFSSYQITISISIIFLVSFWIKEHLFLSNRM